MSIRIVAVLAIAIAAALLSLRVAGPPTPIDYELPPVDLDSADLIERGRYLALAGNCATCHTVAGGEFMAGGLPFETPFGRLYSTNITPDEETGIGTWTPAAFLASMRLGVRPDGTHLYPAFPYTAFTRVSDDDVAALYAYLMSLPAVRQAAPDNELSFPFNVRALMAAWKAMFFDAGPYSGDESKSAQWNRGAYLVEGLAHCGACHTPRNAFGAEDTDRFMAGGEYLDRVPGGAYRPWSAPNLTASGTGLGLWTDEDLVSYLQTGRNSFLDAFVLSFNLPLPDCRKLSIILSNSD